MTSRACLRCGHVSDSAGDAPDVCPICAAEYGRTEAALARGEALDCPAPDELARRQVALQESASERPGRLISLIIAVVFSFTLLTLLAGIAVIILILAGVSKGMAGHETASVTALAIVPGWICATVTSVGFSFARRPVAGVIWGMALGLLAGILAVSLIQA